ncbi:DUF4013 domain-containing protein [Phototrophicus methaneseepsis]|uniref:DUF4013 domain-containing protein n=1 Tax=Phototrophicus methaneseepsis TaxID=2710758 RepID=A0A7S8ECB6_9CHLR|nr:DUF4013 domain-containing protein [Phototrophicus methaneseepsis]QPC84350.1 DUF4013 domain-containing protein [Phototrophicus methaneseepsis]
MDFGYSLSYVFEDERWISKLAMLLLFTLLSAVPLLGLLALAVALGYLVELVGNVRTGFVRPLPEWDNIEEKFRLGGYLLIAWFIYHIPFVLFNAGTSWLFGVVGGGFLGDATTLVIACCLLPFSLIYILAAWCLFAVGVIEYSDTGQIGVFFRFTELLWVLRRYSSLTIQWVIMAFFINVLLALLALIPCLGWIAAPALAIPWQGHLLGQYARHVGVDSDRRKDKVRRKSPPKGPR